jgi:hypothetical protein
MVDNNDEREQRVPIAIASDTKATKVHRRPRIAVRHPEGQDSTNESPKHGNDFVGATLPSRSSIHIRLMRMGQNQ